MGGWEPHISTIIGIKHFFGYSGVLFLFSISTICSVVSFYEGLLLLHCNQQSGCLPVPLFVQSHKEGVEVEVGGALSTIRQVLFNQTTVYCTQTSVLEVSFSNIKFWGSSLPLDSCCIVINQTEAHQHDQLATGQRKLRDPAIPDRRKWRTLGESERK